MTKIHVFIMGLFVGILVAPGQSVDSQYGRLTIHIVSFSGGKLPQGKLSIQSRQGVSVFSRDVKDETSAKLPYGEYVVGYESKFLKTVQREVVIDRADSFMVLATDMEDIVLDVKHDPVSVSIRVRPSNSCLPEGFLWASLTGVFSRYRAELKIGTLGFGLFEQVDVGTYAIIIVDGQSVRAVQTVTTKGPITVVDITLPECK